MLLDGSVAFKRFAKYETELRKEARALLLTCTDYA